MSAIDTITTALNHGRVDAAVAASRELLASHDLDTALRDLGLRLGRLYTDYLVVPVDQYIARVGPSLPQGKAGLLTHSFREEHDLTAQWARRLAELGSERLANEIADHIKANNLPAAEESAHALIMQIDSPEARAQRARQVGNILGGLLFEKDRAAKLLRTISRAPQRFGIDGPTAVDMEEEFQRSQVAALKRERSAGSMSRVELTQIVVELSRTLPGRMAIHDPNPDDFAAFGAQLRAMMRAALASYRNSKLHEVSLLLVEFSPREISAAGAMAGVEQRLATSLGRTARTVSQRVMTEVGAHPRVFDAYLTFAKEHADTTDRLAPTVVEVLGLWRNPGAADFLARIATDRKHAARHEAMLALGNMGGHGAEKTLTQALAHAVSGRTIEGDQRRDAVTAISALGRLVRAMPAEQRGAVISAALKAIPTRDTELVIRAILNFFVGNFDTYNPAQLKWAAQVATMALWTVDRPELAKAARNAPLGFRQPLIDLLERLAPHAMETINETVMSSAKTYSAAYMAVAELYAKVPDPSQLPVLRQLLLNTFLYDDQSPRSAYTRETVRDVETEQQVELRKDQVLGSLIYAVDKIGGDEASAILADLFEQIRAGRLPQPGRDAADILFTAYTKSGAGQAMLKGTMPTAGNMSDTAAQAAVPHLDAAEVTRLLQELEGSYLMAAKRRTKKVPAMAALAHAKAVAALPAIISHLGDKDPIIAAAAQTALTDFASPPVPKAILGHYLDELLRTLEIGDDQTKVKLVDVFMRLGPRKSPLKERLEKLAHNVNLSMGTKSVLARLLEPPPEAAPAAEESSGSDHIAESAPTARNLQISRLDRMRAYNQARQAWIKKGKHGPEPKPPE